MNLEDYCIAVESQNKDIPNSFKLQEAQQKEEESISDDEELDHNYIINNCPPVKMVREYFRHLLEKDDTPEFLK